MSASLRGKKAIALHNVSYRYPKSQSPVLQIDSWDLAYGEQVFIQGLSGSGKSTLLNVLSGILKANTGDVIVLGKSFSDMASHQRDAFRANNIGVVYQQFNLIPYLSVIENIQLAVYFSDQNKTFENDYCQQLFLGLNLDLTLMNRRADALSVGQQQRVAIARALINRPQLLIVDEPTSALDNAAKHAFMTLLMSLVQGNDITLVFVSHDDTLKPYFSKQTSMIELNSVVMHHVH